MFSDGIALVFLVLVSVIIVFDYLHRRWLTERVDYLEESVHKTVDLLCKLTASHMGVSEEALMKMADAVVAEKVKQEEKTNEG